MKNLKLVIYSRSFLILVVLVILAFISNTEASVYVIKFIEGAYKYDPSKKIDSIDNKYLSKVTITKDKIVLVEVRGSTLPDSATFYQLWHKYQREDSPSDSDVYDLYVDARTNQYEIESLKKVAILPEEFVDFMYKWVTYTPVLYSGLYKFTIGLHQNHRTEKRPYVPRIMGTNIEKPFSAKNGYQKKDWKSTVQDGGFIETITYNENHSGHIANGVNIHDGNWNGSHRGSSGCLTIDPRKWKKFLDNLPNIESWSKDNHEGYVVIVRKGEEDLECKIWNNCPTNMQKPQAPNSFGIHTIN